jgi:hypothetical protein
MRSRDQLSSDAELLSIRLFNRRIRLSRAFSDAGGDLRYHGLIGHALLEMVRARVSSILTLRRRGGPAFRDRAVGVEVAMQEVARVGPIDGGIDGQLRCRDACGFFPNNSSARERFPDGS